MSETPEEQRPAPPPESPAPESTPASSPAPAAAQSTAAPVQAAPSRPATQPVYQSRTFQLVAVGVVGLLLGGMLGLGIGLTAGFAFGGHGRGDVHHHQQWGPGDGYRQPDRKRLPDRPFVPKVRKQPGLPSPAAPSPAAPSPQSS